MVTKPLKSGTESPPSKVGVMPGDHRVTLHDEEVFGSGSGSHRLCSVFLSRVFTVEAVRSVQVDQSLGTAVVRCRKGGPGTPDLLQRLAQAIRGPDPREGGGGETGSPSTPNDLPGPRFEVYRHLGMLTTWEVVADEPGTLRVRPPEPSRSAEELDRLSGRIEAVHGVLRCRYRRLSGTFQIQFDPVRTSTGNLLRELDSPAREVDGVVPSAGEPVKFGLANTALALSAVTDLAAPGLWPVCTGLLVGTNLGTARDAMAQASRGTFGLPVLYTSIAAATIASGQFLPWAVMGWMLRFWKHRYQADIASARRHLLGDVVQEQRFARLETPTGVEVEVPVERLTRGDTILVAPGERIPVDGRVVGGSGLVDEQVIVGVLGMSRKEATSPVFAGSVLLSGALRVETARQGQETRCARLARVALAACTPAPGARTPSREGEQFAGRLVGPTLATAGLGLYLGGAPMALAIMRTDYATGPGLAYPLETLQAIAICLRQGIVIRDPSALARLEKTDVLIVQPHPALEATRAEVASLRVFPGHSEFQVLRYAATAMNLLDDPRSAALRTECLARRIAVLHRIPMDYTNDLTFSHRGKMIKVGNLGSDGPRPAGGASGPETGAVTAGLDSLMVGIDGQIAGLIHFRQSSRLAGEDAIRIVRNHTRRPLAIGLLSDRSNSRTRALATAIGADFHRGGIGPEELAEIIRATRRRGLEVAFAGDCRANPAAARAADLAIALGGGELELREPGGAPIILLQPDLARLGMVQEVARVCRRRIKVAEGSALIPNFACVAGAFLLGFSSLTTIAVTNLATYSTYARTGSGIRRLEQKLARTTGRQAAVRRSRRPGVGAIP